MTIHLIPITTDIARAAKSLASGNLVAMPTETVYGLAADAGNPAAIEKLYTLKGRPGNHPVIVHLASVEQLPQWAKAISPEAEQLAKAFWPGPLTLIFEKHPWVLDSITGNQPTVGIRIPAHPVAQDLLMQFSKGVVAPSANRFGRLSPTRAEDVQAEFDSGIDWILQGGACNVGVESTIVDVSNPNAAPVLLRPGMILPAQIEAVLGCSLGVPGQSPRVPGSLQSHYAPRAQVRLCHRNELESTIGQYDLSEKRVGILIGEGERFSNSAAIVKTMPADPVAYAAQLYSTLRALDSQACEVILVCCPPDAPEWLAIMDRLTRAACCANEGCS